MKKAYQTIDKEAFGRCVLCEGKNQKLGSVKRNLRSDKGKKVAIPQVYKVGPAPRKNHQGGLHHPLLKFTEKVASSKGEPNRVLNCSNSAARRKSAKLSLKFPKPPLSFNGRGRRCVINPAKNESRPGWVKQDFRLIAFAQKGRAYRQEQPSIVGEGGGWDQPHRSPGRSQRCQRVPSFKTGGISASTPLHR